MFVCNTKIDTSKLKLFIITKLKQMVAHMLTTKEQGF